MLTQLTKPSGGIQHGLQSVLQVYRGTHKDRVTLIQLGDDQCSDQCQLVIEPILVLNLVRVRSSWLGLGTEPPADRSPNRCRIVWMRRSMHTWPIKLCHEAREIADWQTDWRRHWSGDGDVDRNSISIVSQRITGGSQQALTTPQYLDKTDSADRRQYSCDIIKTLRATEATRSATSKAVAAAIIRGHTRVGRLHAMRHSWH